MNSPPDHQTVQTVQWDQIAREWPLSGAPPDMSGWQRRVELAAISPCPPRLVRWQGPFFDWARIPAELRARLIEGEIAADRLEFEQGRQ